MSINVNDKNLGHATAYAYYKAGGGTMTEAEFTEFMADFGTASQTAVEAAQAALASKNAAQTAATTATTKASEATTAATTATTKAGEASTSASTATSAKDTAVSASQTATSKATEATTAAATATSAATTATTAKDDAVSAKTAAQTAQTGAETAAASVEASAAQIQTNADDISELKEDLTLLLDKEPTRNLFDKNTMENVLIDGSGNVTPSDQYVTSDYILCKNAKVMISSVGAVERQYKYRVAVYDGSKTWMRRALGATDTFLLDGVNNCYIRITFENARQTDFDTAQVELGTTATAYVPHQMAYDYNGRALIANIQTAVNYSDDFGTVVFNDGYYAGYTSTVDDIIYTENATLSYSDPIPVVPKSAIRLQNIWKAGYSYCIWLDYNKKYLGKATASSNASETASVRVDAPLNAYYMIVNVLTDHKNIFSIDYYANLTDFIKADNIEKTIYGYNHVGNTFQSIVDAGPMFSLCDDDTTSLELVQIYHDVCDDNNVKGCYAAITFRLDDDTNLASELLQYETEGFGVYYHCQRQIEAYRPTNFDEATAQVNFVQGLRKFKEYGFLNDDIWLIPYGGANSAIISMARKHGIRYLVDGKITIGPYSHHVTDKFYNYPSKYLNHYNVIRNELAAYDKEGYTIAELKAAIDECAENKGWIIITTHVNTWYQKNSNNQYLRDGNGDLIPIVTDGETGESRLREIIQYCQSKGMTNKTIAQGLSLYDPVYNWSESI